MSYESWFVPASAQVGGEAALFALRFLLLFCFWWGVQTERKLSEWEAVSLFFVASLGIRILFVPWLLTTLFLMQRRPLPELRPGRVWSETTRAAGHWLSTSILALAAISASMIVMSRYHPRAPLRSPAPTPAECTRVWLEKQNPYRALSCAHLWASQDKIPGLGSYTLAGIEWQVGHRARALERLRMIMEDSQTAPVIKKRAQNQSLLWRDILDAREQHGR